MGTARSGKEKFSNPGGGGIVSGAPGVALVGIGGKLRLPWLLAVFTAGAALTGSGAGV